MDEQWGAAAAVVAVVAFLAGGLSVLFPPGVFWFAVLDCPPQGDCVPVLGPLALGLLTMLLSCALLLGIGVVHLVGVGIEWRRE